MCANITKIIEDTAIREHKLRKCLLFKRLVLCKTARLLLFVCVGLYLPPIHRHRCGLLGSNTKVQQEVTKWKVVYRF